MTRPQYIYFEPRTGIVKDRPIRSNFYVYRLRSSLLAKVELAVSGHSSLKDEGFVYPQEFIEWLDRNDTHWDQRKGLPVPFEYGGLSD